MTNTTKTIQELNLSDGFLFAKVMDDKEICRKVLETILGISIRKVSMPAKEQPPSLMRRKACGSMHTLTMTGKRSIMWRWNAGIRKKPSSQKGKVL